MNDFLTCVIFCCQNQSFPGSNESAHGELKPFMSIGGWQTFAHDEAGRKWVANFGEPYKLFKEETHKVVYKKF